MLVVTTAMIDSLLVFSDCCFLLFEKFLVFVPGTCLTLAVLLEVDEPTSSYTIIAFAKSFHTFSRNRTMLGSMSIIVLLLEKGENEIQQTPRKVLKTSHINVEPKEGRASL